MSIPFTQYIRPNGHKKQIIINRPEEIEKLAKTLIAEGVHFDVEILTNDMVSMTAEKDDKVLSIELSPREPQIEEKIDSLIKCAYRMVFFGGKNEERGSQCLKSHRK